MDDPYREPVALSDVDPAWASVYAAEAARIGAALDGLDPVVEHIGSTAVPLRGKPIVDIQVAVAEDDRRAAIAAIRGLGYEHHGRGGVPGRDYLTRRPPRGPAVNVHVFDAGNPLLADNRAIRDYLRADPEAARAYVLAKEQALAHGHDDLVAYSDAKHDRVAAIRDAALRRQAARGG